MNARLVTVVVGTIIFLLGLAGLFYPGRVMGVLGMLPLNPSHAAAALGEVRATYGGLFVVMGAYTLLAGMDPAAHRSRLLFVSLLWLGACAARLFGAYVDGNPGLPGWLAAGFELLIGGALLAVAVHRAPTTAAGGGRAGLPPSV
jgi:Domain of unknown function (DUF4345)